MSIQNSLPNFKNTPNLTKTFVQTNKNIELDILKGMLLGLTN